MTSQLDRRTFTRFLAALLALAAAGAAETEAAEPERPPRSPVPPGYHIVGWFTRTGDHEGSAVFTKALGPDGDAIVTDKGSGRPISSWLLDALGARLAD